MQWRNRVVALGNARAGILTQAVWFHSLDILQLHSSVQVIYYAAQDTFELGKRVEIQCIPRQARVVLALSPS